MYLFWKESGNVTRTALACAGISILINISTYFGVGPRGPMAAAFVMHFAAMAFGFISLFRTGHHHSLYATRIIEPESLLITPRKQLPGIMTVKPLFLPVILSFIYFLVQVNMSQNAEAPHREALTLRFFSSVWIFFLITTAAWDEYYRLRIEALKDLPSKEAA